jgi:hypothetical protein
MLVLPLILGAITAFAPVDTNTMLQFFPLGINYRWEYAGDNFGNNFITQKQITKDTIIDSRRYFVETTTTLKGVPVTTGRRLVRMDSSTLEVRVFYPQTLTETTLYKFGLAIKGDSVVDSSGGGKIIWTVPQVIGNDKRRTITCYIIHQYESWRYSFAESLGLARESYSLNWSPGGRWYDSLTSAVINGSTGISSKGEISIVSHAGTGYGCSLVNGKVIRIGVVGIRNEDVSLVDVLGNRIPITVTNSEKGFSLVRIQSNHNLAKGVYVLNVNHPTSNRSYRLIF